MTTISRSELERMRALTRPDEITDAESRRRRLKALSDDKVKNWPNTIHAMRLKKENWKQERMIEEEKQRCEVDREEAELAKAKRLMAISRANAMMYEQTDKMKNLRSQQMYSDVLYDREEQVREKTVMSSWEREKERAYHLDVVRQVAEGDSREAREAAARERKERVIAESQRGQLGEFRESYLERLRSEKREGELVRVKAERDLEEEKSACEERALKARYDVSEMQSANARLRSLKAEHALEEQKEEVARKVGLATKEHVAKERVRLEKQRFEARQQTKQRLIDTASVALATKTDADAERLETQVDAMRQKEDDLELVKQANQRAQKRAIDVSRQQQLEARSADRARDERDVADRVTVWRVKNAEIEAEERGDRDARHRKQREIRQDQESCIQRHERDRKREHGDKLRDERAQLLCAKQDDDRFKQVADVEINKATDQGKPTFMLHKAKNAKDLTIMPAGGSRI